MISNSEPAQNMFYNEPSIPHEAADRMNDDTGGFSSSIRNLMRRFTRSNPESHQANSSTLMTASAPLEQPNVPECQGLEPTDVYIKHCDLHKGIIHQLRRQIGGRSRANVYFSK